MSQLPAFREVRDKYGEYHESAGKHGRAGSADSFREGFLVEVEAVAVVPE